jgi:predicted RNA-binding protein (virulence factor B family)
MVAAGQYHKLKIVKKVDFGIYLDGNGDEILLPKRYVTPAMEPGEEVEVFIYHDGEDRIIATTDKPVATVGEIALMRVKDITPHGAFMHWGIMKDLFVPISQQTSRMFEGESYLIYLYVDEQTGRVAGSEKFSKYLSNDELTVNEKDQVSLLVWQKTDIGYKVIINNKHTGVLHFNDVFRDLDYGETVAGYVKTIREENKIDIGVGERGYKRVLTETEKILELLRENGGYLPYHDKSDPAEIYEFFGISKKAFKMATGALFKERKIEFVSKGIKLMDSGD